MAPTFGVLEVLCQQLLCHFEDVDETINGFKALCKPTILENGQTSTVHHAVEKAVPLLSTSGIIEIAEHVPWMMYQATPDACSVNMRREERVLEQLPNNVLGIKTRCVAHQGHRIISSREPGVIGNVHAFRVSCSNVHHGTRMQKALWKVLGAVWYTTDHPDPSWHEGHRIIAKRTLLRQNDLVCASAEEGTSCLDLAVWPVHRFLDAWNGNWSDPRPSHFDPSGSRDKEQAQRLMYATAMEIDFLLSSDRRSPSSDDWGSCGESAAQVSFRLMVHNVFKDCVEDAFPDWGSGKPPNDRRPDVVDIVAYERRRIQKKVWRTKCTLRSPDRCLDIHIYAWGGEPVEHLIQKTQALDSRHGGLMDMAFLDRLNPIFSCKLDISKIILMDGDMKSEFAPLVVWITAHEEANGIPLTDALWRLWKVELDMGAQAELRFGYLSLFPFQWAYKFHPAVRLEERERTYRDFFERHQHPCCRSRYFDEKVWGHVSLAGAAASTSTHR